MQLHRTNINSVNEKETTKQQKNSYLFPFPNLREIGLRAVLCVLNMLVQQWFNGETCTNF